MTGTNETEDMELMGSALNDIVYLIRYQVNNNNNKYNGMNY